MQTIAALIPAAGLAPRDRAPGVQEDSQPQKIVRVVSTVQYFLD